MKPEDQKLFATAKATRENSHAPHSGHQIGAAVLCEDGKIFAGTNVEHLSFGLTVCAERVALSSAIAAGARRFKKVFVVAKKAVTPCGICRQVIWDLCGPIPVICSDLEGHCRNYTSGELLPHPYDDSSW